MTSVSKIRQLLTPPERRGALMLLALMLVGMALEMLSTGLVVPVIALITQQDLAQTLPSLQPLLEKLGNPGQADLIMMAMLALVGIYLAKNLFLGYLGWRQTRFAFGVQAQLSQRLFALYLRQPYTFHLQRNSAQLVRNATGEVNIITHAIVSGLTVATETLVVIGISALLLIVEPLGALLAVALLGGCAWVFHRTTRSRISRWGKLRHHHDGLRIQHLLQGLGGAKDVKLLGREGEFLAQFRTHNLQSARVAQYQATLQMLPRLWLELLAVGGLATVVITMLAQGRDTTSIVPTLGLFAAAAFRLMPSVNRVLAAVQAVRYSAPAIAKLHEELKLTSNDAQAANERQTKSGATASASLKTEMRLLKVSYVYPGANTPALRDVTIHIRKGESVGFIGASGSGKSTLVDVILGLLGPSSGQVLVDERDIKANLRAWQNQIGYVAQSIYLTDDTLRRNVAFGLSDEEIDDASVKRAIKAAQLEDFVTGLSEGLNTMVGERGVRLSGGQRQRIGIARALYHDPAVLVLDEATSALDTAVERGVMEAVNALHGSKTLLIVAHRLSTVEHCDRLYRLERGSVVDEGSFERVTGKIVHRVSS